jgi:proline dehydrogenase
MGLFHAFVLALLPHVPKPLMRRLSARYIAGETLEEALARLEDLRKRGYAGILDILGEDVEDEQHARAVVRAYQQAADALVARKLDAYISIKPTHMGLRLSEPLALAHYREVAAHARSRGMRMRVEMEDHTTTEATLRLFEALRKEFDNVGLVLQSRLLRTPADIAALAPGPLHVRMVKGIYIEPAAIAHTEPEPIRAAFLECTRLLWSRGAFVSLATHDPDLATRLMALAENMGIKRERFEFQVLLGVQEQLWARWKAEGHAVRVYVPFGPEWRPYSLRRLRRNPQILGHVLRASLRLR